MRVQGYAVADYPSIPKVRRCSCAVRVAVWRRKRLSQLCPIMEERFLLPGDDTSTVFSEEAVSFDVQELHLTCSRVTRRLCWRSWRVDFFCSRGTCRWMPANCWADAPEWRAFESWQIHSSWQLCSHRSTGLQHMLVDGKTRENVKREKKRKSDVRTISLGIPEKAGARRWLMSE